MRQPAGLSHKSSSLPRSFEDTVLSGLSAFLKECGRPQSRRPLALLALSGGADSTAMAAAMADIRDKSGQLELHALHVNHGIRPPANCLADENTARDLCNRLKISFSVKKIAPGAVKSYAAQYGTGIEGAARHFRYNALAEEAKRLMAAGIFIAHTVDDRLETILMAFLRGSGPAGLGALSAPGDKTMMSIVRPLLALSRKEVLDFLKTKNLTFCDDETNDDTHFFRNRVRRFLVPLLDEHFPQWREPVLRLGETQAMTAAFLKSEAEKRLLEKGEFDKKNSVYRVLSELFFSESELIREEALFQALDFFAESENAGKKPRRDTLRSFVRGGAGPVTLGQCRLENKNGFITVKKTERLPAFHGFSVLIKNAGLYKLDHITVIAGTEQEKTTEQEETAETAEQVFFAALPLVLYSEREGKILAEDRLGRAAEVKNGVLVRRRKAETRSGMISFRILT